MKEMQRTLAYATVALLTLVIAVFAAAPRAKQPKEFENVGTEFFPNFTDATQAKALQVVAFNADTATTQTFAVEFKDGQWRIPSRHNYPVDGKDQLAKTAASVIGIRREGLVGRSESQYPEFNVVDPETEDATNLQSRGQKITLQDGDRKTLASYIIGKAVPSQAGYYYVRAGDGSDKNVYRAKLDIKLSTKFVDWIEPDLLKLDGFRLVDVTIDKYTIDAEQERIVGKEVNVLTRKNSQDPWKLSKLDESKEELNKAEVDKLVAALDDLKIVGVRPKPARLSKDLRLQEGIKVDQMTLVDLGTKGFILAPVKGGGLELVSKEGDLIASTDQGVSYVLHFGEVFTGTEQEIEVGFASQEAKPADQDAAKDADAKDGDKKDTGKKRSRYLFVTTQFDETHLGAEPTKPTEPQSPSLEEIAAFNEAPADAFRPANVTGEPQTPETKFAAAKAKYAQDLQKYETDLADFKDRRLEGEKLVKDLNARFADWYYVIDAESFESLRQGRKTLVQPKGTTPAKATTPPPGLPGFGGFPQ